MRLRRRPRGVPPLPSYQLEIAVDEDDGYYQAWVYLGVQLVFEVRQPAEEFPAGIEDFSRWAMRQFGKRMHALMQPDPDNPGMTAETATELRGW